MEGRIKMITELQLTTEELMTEFKEALTSGINGFVKAGEIYVKAIDQDPSNAERMQIQFRDIVPPKAWKQFEAIGRKWVHPKLILGGMSDPKKTNIVKRLPYSLQNRVFQGEKFELLISDGDVLEVSALDASSDQVKQLFGDGNLRTLREQKAYIENNKLQEDLKPQELPYYFQKGRIIFRKNTELTRAEMKQLLTQL
jgi:hypothetical protein